MMNIRKALAFFSTKGKAYYPFFMASDYTPLEYSPYYVPSNLQLGAKGSTVEN
jgi:hypothetical protein